MIEACTKYRSSSATAKNATENMVADAAEPRRFDIALSFQGEQRDYVKEVAALLASTFSEGRVLYEHFHDAEFARLDLNTYLSALYRKDSELIVIFLCPEYAAKLWCRLEWRHISQLIVTVDAQRIMFLSFDNPGHLSDLARAPASKARRATWTKPGKSPNAARCRSSWPTSTCTAPGFFTPPPLTRGPLTLRKISVVPKTTSPPPASSS